MRDEGGIVHRPRCGRPGGWAPIAETVPMAFGTRLRVLRCLYCRQTSLPDVVGRSSDLGSGSANG
jgi:hypothetical protein